MASQTALSQVAPGLSNLAAWRIGGALAVSTLTTFLFLLIVYRTLPNTEVTTRQVLPGALIATALLQLTFELLPLYVRSVEGLPALKAFGGAAVLLVWLYLMGNVVLLGGAFTWWSARGRGATAELPGRSSPGPESPPRLSRPVSRRHPRAPACRARRPGSGRRPAGSDRRGRVICDGSASAPRATAQSLRVRRAGRTARPA